MDIIDSKTCLSYDESFELFEKFKLSLFNRRSWDNVISKDEINLMIPASSPPQISQKHSSFYHILIDFKNVDPLARERKKKFNTVLLNFVLMFDLHHSCGAFYKNVSNKSTLIIIRNGLLVIRDRKKPACAFDNRLGFVPRIESPLTIEISIAMIEQFINHSKRFVKERQQTWDKYGSFINCSRNRTYYYHEGIVYYNYNSQLPNLTNGIRIY